MTARRLYLDLFALAADTPLVGDLENRVKMFLESQTSTESLDDAAFALMNGSDIKADYLLGQRSLIAELKTMNGNPHNRIEQRLKERFAKPGAPIVYGKVGLSKVIEGMEDRDTLNKMLVDLVGRGVRRHLQKANDQIAAIKTRLNLPNAGGLVILMNDAEPMIDAGAIGYAIDSAFNTVEGGYPHITNVWASIESHKIRMPGKRIGYPQLHVYRSLVRLSELDFMGRLLSAWGEVNGSCLERLEHHGDWNAMKPIYERPPPSISPFRR